MSVVEAVTREAPHAQAARNARSCAMCADTDTLKSYTAANKDLGINIEQNSHQPARICENVMRRFKSAPCLQRFASIRDQVANLFMHCRCLTYAPQKRALRT
jgi:putative transposase